MFILANKKIKELNDQEIKECDYLRNDYYGTVGVATYIKNNILEYAYICDAGMVIYDKNGNIKFQTKDKKKEAEQYEDKIEGSWSEPWVRAFYRKTYRNKPNLIMNGGLASFGVLTGEDEAIPFIREGSIKLEQDDIVICYSDGFVNYFEREDFFLYSDDFNEEKFNNYIDNLSKSDYKKYGKEKTIVIYKNKDID